MGSAVSLIRVTDDFPPVPDLFSIGKTAATKPTPAYTLSGRLYLSKSGWILLTVPNDLVRGIFAAMDEPGIELPPSGPREKLDAHISVIRPEELETIEGGADAITERGKSFKYTLGRLVTVRPAGWSEMSQAWFMTVHSTELQSLRKSYGLSPRPKDNEFDFHVTVAVRRKSVLGRNETSKAADSLAKESAVTTGLKVITITARDLDDSLENLLEHIKVNGNGGHSFSIDVDPDGGKDQRQKFYWDGDGADYIKSVEVDEPDVCEHCGKEILEKSLYCDPEGNWFHRSCMDKGPIKWANPVDDAAKNINPNPTDKQKETGNYRKGHVRVHGLDIALENGKGQTRSGTAKNGKKWSIVMKHAYGYIKRTEGSDGDHVDVFVGDHPESEKVFIVNQVDPDSGKFDEHKCMLGFDSEDEARKGYLANYEKGWKGLGSMKAMSIGEFKDWLKGDTTKEAAVEPMPVWVNPKGSGKPLSAEFLNSPGVQNFLGALGCASDEQGKIHDVAGNPKKAVSAVIFSQRTCLIAPSPIHGRGVYAKDEYQTGDTIDRALVLLPPELSNPDEREYVRTTVGRFTNHSEHPNSKIVPNGNDWDLVATQEIQPGEEIVADYIEANDDLFYADTTPYDFNYDIYLSDEGIVDETQEGQGKEANDQPVKPQPICKKDCNLEFNLLQAATGSKAASLPRQKVQQFVETFSKGAAEPSGVEGDNGNEADTPVVAVDLDGTLAEYDGFKGQGEYGKPRPGAVAMMKNFHERGYKIIIHTCRNENQNVKAWLQEHEIPYDHINVNPANPPGTSKKPVADAYVDDKAVPAEDLEEAERKVHSLIESKEAASSLMGRAFMATPIRYDSQRGLLQGIVDHFHRVRQRGQEFLQHQRNSEEWANLGNPRYKQQQFLNALHGRKKPVSPYLADKALLNNQDLNDILDSWQAASR